MHVTTKDCKFAVKGYPGGKKSTMGHMPGNGIPRKNMQIMLMAYTKQITLKAYTKQRRITVFLKERYKNKLSACFQSVNGLLCNDIH